MRLYRLILAVLLTAALAMLAGVALAARPEAPPPAASAELRDAQGKVVGNAVLMTLGSGAVSLQVTLAGLAGAAGEHGLHIHAVGSCAPTFAAAGGHFNPGGAKHGLVNPAGPHAGDLPALTLAVDGSARYTAITDRVSLESGARSLFDADGSALVIHAMPDDQATDPTGNSGDRIACGVLMASATANSAVTTSNGSVTFETCQGACQVKDVDPTTLGRPVRAWQSFRLTQRGLQTSFVDANARVESYVGRPQAVCFPYTAAEAAEAGGESHLRVAYWDASLKDGAGSGRWYRLRTTYGAGQACARLRLAATFALVIEP